MSIVSSTKGKLKVVQKIVSSVPGFEPGIFWSVVRRVIRCATHPCQHWCENAIHISYQPETIENHNILNSSHFDVWGCGSVVERPLRMWKAPGSIPGISKIIMFWNGIFISSSKNGDAGDRTRGLSHAKRTLYHWATSPDDELRPTMTLIYDIIWFKCTQECCVAWWQIYDHGVRITWKVVSDSQATSDNLLNQCVAI